MFRHVNLYCNFYSNKEINKHKIYIIISKVCK